MKYIVNSDIGTFTCFIKQKLTKGSYFYTDLGFFTVKSMMWGIENDIPICMLKCTKG